jgi:DinB superfamily
MKTKYPIRRFVDPIENPYAIPDLIPEGIVKTVGDFSQRFRSLDESKASYKPDEKTWSLKEILGHLIDSASNNHQRFVRAQYFNQTNFPSYAQDEWVAIQRYNERQWKELLTLWTAYNLHLAHIISNIPREQLDTECTIGDGEPVTLAYIIVDYLGHMQHHIKQMEEM